MRKLPRPEHPGPALTAEEGELGMARDITRRDFLNAVALGTGAALLGSVAPALAKNPVAASPTQRRSSGIRGPATGASVTTRSPMATPGKS